jgi:hypothetical protein
MPLFFPFARSCCDQGGIRLGKQEESVRTAEKGGLRGIFRENRQKKFLRNNSRQSVLHQKKGLPILKTTKSFSFNAKRKIRLIKGMLLFEVLQ